MDSAELSAQAYETIKANGLLSKRRFEVYDILHRKGPLTAHEIVDIAREFYPKTNQTSFNARLSELEDAGVVDQVGEKVNPISGMRNTLWAANGNLPRKQTQREKLVDLIHKTEERLERLRDRLVLMDSKGTVNVSDLR